MPQQEQYSDVDIIKTSTGATCTVADISGLSNPPSGKCKVTNLYVNEEGKLVIEYENTPKP